MFWFAPQKDEGHLDNVQTEEDPPHYVFPNHPC